MFTRVPLGIEEPSAAHCTGEGATPMAAIEITATGDAAPPRPDPPQ